SGPSTGPGWVRRPRCSPPGSPPGSPLGPVAAAARAPPQQQAPAPPAGHGQGDPVEGGGDEADLTGRDLLAEVAGEHLDLDREGPGGPGADREQLGVAPPGPDQEGSAG